MNVTNIIFAQPFTVNAALAEKCTNEVIVLDLAFDGQNFEKTTKPFIETLGDKLIMWVDHHDHQEWTNYQGNPRFLLYPRKQYAACPPMITPELLVQYTFGEDVTIICHGDFDGIMAATKFTLNGQEPYPMADYDAIAIDSRTGKPTTIGKYIDEVLKVDIRNNAIRLDVYQYLLDITDSSNKYDIDVYHQRYEAIQARTNELATHFEVSPYVAWTTAINAGEYDLTQLLLAGQKKAAVAVVLHNQQGKQQYTIAGPSSWNFVEMFGLKGGMPNRINLPGENFSIEAIISKINS